MNFTCTAHFQSGSAMPQNKKVLVWESATAPKRFIQPTSSSSSSMEFLKCDQGTKGTDSILSLSCISTFPETEGAPLHQMCTVLVGKELHSLSLLSWVWIQKICFWLLASCWLLLVHCIYPGISMQSKNARYVYITKWAPPYEKKNCNWKLHVQFLIFK